MAPAAGKPDRQQHERDDHQADGLRLTWRGAPAQADRRHRRAERQPAGHERLHHRQRRLAHRSDVQRPAGDADCGAGGPDGRAQQRTKRPQRPARVDGCRAARARVLHQIGRVECHGGRDREHHADDGWAHRRASVGSKP